MGKKDQNAMLRSIRPQVVKREGASVSGTLTRVGARLGVSTLPYQHEIGLPRAY